jgi:HlyD family secretion protein
VEETVTNSKAGSVAVRRRANLSVGIPGRVKEIYHREGDSLKAGELLILLEDSEARAALNLTERELETAIALQKEARIRCDQAQRQYQRYKQLYKKKVISESELDKVHSYYLTCMAGLEGAQARVAQLKASVQLARARLNKHALRAPFGGILTELLIEAGEWALPGKPVVQIMDPNDLYVRAELDELDIGRVRPGLPVRVTLEPLKGRRFHGTVSRVSAFVSERLEQSRTVKIEVEFDETEDLESVKPGMSADVEVILKEREGVLRIPTHALLESERVLIVKDGFAVSRQIQTGLRNWEFVEVKGGLKEGDAVIVSLDRKEIREGARVIISKKGS